MLSLPDGFHYVDIVSESRLEDSLTWSEDELVGRLRETRTLGSAQEVIACGYCGTKRRCRTGKSAERGAIAWFHSHECLAGASTGETSLPAPERVPALAA